MTASQGIRSRRFNYAAATVAQLRALIYSRPGTRADRVVYDRRYRARRELARRELARQQAIAALAATSLALAEENRRRKEEADRELARQQAGRRAAIDINLYDPRRPGPRGGRQYAAPVHPRSA